MAQIKIVCGHCIFDKNKWLFGVEKGTKKYKVNEQIYDVELSYMYSKKVLVTLPQNTPPVEINNQRQFTGFLEQLKTEVMQVCLELKERFLEEDEVASDDEDEGSIFDYCDDVDDEDEGSIFAFFVE
ncbi:unnamed protein product [Eruca vesicaria subsp. sativa]|uniref:Uncharacterized protein n=1 Tax=Eruca vesicaria subsp. sativa TaxID=29727 RepID=A0ABC8JRW1_ERUVS|nr:unnamed protein product [Eruca vesicaria subsp. sativa]